MQRPLGHMTAEGTLDSYGHLWPGSDDRPRHAVDAQRFATTLREVAWTPHEDW